MEELWGCVKYIGIPYDTVMNMPIQTRKNWIMRHNAEEEKLQAIDKNGQGTSNREISGEGINAFAGIEQSNNNNMK